MPKTSLPLAIAPQVVTLDDRATRALSPFRHFSGIAVAVGVSGGKDSCAVAMVVDEHLKAVKFKGPRILIHSDLGLVEWEDSLPTCQRLAKFLGWELVVVRRAAGDMMDRWNKRWSNNVARYTNMECVKLIPPWSTASMRFCTSELKRDVICQALVKRFPQHEIVSVSGIRRDESTKRAKSPITKDQPKLTNQTWNTTGFDWHAILDWNLEGVYDYLKRKKFRLHEAYTKYGSSRVSCAFCILGSKHDLAASATCSSNWAAYRAMCDLEIRSTFSFQDKQWLFDVAPHVLTAHQAKRRDRTRADATSRRSYESLIPEHLLYIKGWPTVLPTVKEAETLAYVRHNVGKLLDIKVSYPTGKSIRDRYQELLASKPVA